MALYSLDEDGRSITCRLCDRTSRHPEDVRACFCGHCRVFLVELEYSAMLMDAILDPSRTERRGLDFFRDVVANLNGRGRPTNTG